MNEKLVIVKKLIQNQPCILTILYENQIPIDIRVHREEADSLLGNIYVGKVKNIANNIQAAFIEIAPDISCYYPLKQKTVPIFTNPKKDSTLHQGDELLVQVEREAMKMKAPCVTSDLSFSGKYLVLTTDDNQIALSKKIQGEERIRLKKWLEPMTDIEYGFIIRTNAVYAQKEEIMKEAMFLIQRYQRVKQIANSRPAFTLIEKSMQSYLTVLRDLNLSQLSKVVTDDLSVFEESKAYLEKYQSTELEKLVFYDDKLLSLEKLYRTDKHLSDASNEKVWLKSGGFLIIQQTEACVVIDVNSGKFSKRGTNQHDETFRKINEEAAIEIAHQVRLRNLSGIILIDFINMKKQTYDEELLEQLRTLFKQDPVLTIVIDMTKLHIVEMTRKKVRKSLAEQLLEIKEEK